MGVKFELQNWPKKPPNQTSLDDIPGKNVFQNVQKVLKPEAKEVVRYPHIYISVFGVSLPLSWIHFATMSIWHTFRASQQCVKLWVLTTMFHSLLCGMSSVKADCFSERHLIKLNSSSLSKTTLVALETLCVLSILNSCRLHHLGCIQRWGSQHERRDRDLLEWV